MGLRDKKALQKKTKLSSRTAAELAAENNLLKKALRQSEKRFSKIFNASSNLITITTVKEGRIIDLNEAAADFCGFKRKELIDKRLAQRNIIADPNQREEIIHEVQEKGKVCNAELKVRTKTGDIRTVLYSACPISVNDEPCLLGVSVDITAREKEADATQKTEEKYRALVENSLQGLSIIQDDRFVFCNNAFAEMTGYSVEELMAFSHSKALVYPEDQAAVYRRHQDRMARRPVPAHHVHRIIKKDGSLRWMEICASFIENNGRPAIQVVNMDITERQRAESALRESEERFRLIAETIDEIFWIFDVGKMITTYLSPAFERIYGYPRSCIVGKPGPFLDPIHPDDRARVLAVGADLDSRQRLNFEYRIIRPDGSIRNIWTRGFPVADSNGQVKRYVGVGQDVTEWRQAEEALNESREYLNQIINHIGDPIFVKDREHKFVLVNDAFCTLFGGRPEAYIGETGLEAMRKELAASIWEGEEEVFNTGRENITEDTLVIAQGTPRIVMAKKSLLTDRRGDRQVIGVLRDITEYKHLEAQFLQSQKMEAIGVLAGGVAHDFNNLLNVINGYSEMMLEEVAQDDPMRKDLEQVREAGHRAATLTTQLLAFGRKQILQPEILDLNAVITNMGSMLRRMIGEDIELVCNSQPGLGMVYADRGKIQQVIMNLAVNARDAMPRGGKLVLETANVDFGEDNIREYPITKPGPYVMLAISDNGIGMDAATQARIFEPFFTTKEKGKGTGLGLSTVYGIVEQSNGFIWMDSEPGEGTTFKTYLPRVKGQAAEMPADKQSEGELRGTETVLVVEDEASVRILACRILRDRGYNVLEAPGGAEALEIVRKYEGDIHLVLTDVIMPGMTGSELVSQLEHGRPGIKALYFSGYADGAIVHNGALDSGVDFLQKPFAVEDLARKVREVLNIRQAAHRIA